MLLLLTQTPAPATQPVPAEARAEAAVLERFHFGGYGEIHYNRVAEDGASKLDLHRFVFYVGYDFSDWIKLHSETEIEHGFVEGGQGEVAIEQLHVDFEFDPAWNLRVGRYLQPLGIVNQRHEPPSFNGVERPDVETFILPSTWGGDGVGLFGALGEDWKYQIYLGSSLDGSGIDPVEGLHEARQEGQPGMSQPAVSGRVDWMPTSGLRTGIGVFSGGLDNGPEGVNPGNDARILVTSIDAQWNVGAFDFAALYALDSISDADTIGPTIAERMDGWYVEGAWHCLPDSVKEGRMADADARLFARYESLDTQASMPGGAAADPAGERTIVTIGASYYPVSNLVFKVDYQICDDETAAGLPERFNLGFGWQF